MPRLDKRPATRLPLDDPPADSLQRSSDADLRSPVGSSRDLPSAKEPVRLAKATKDEGHQNRCRAEGSGHKQHPRFGSVTDALGSTGRPRLHDSVIPYGQSPKHRMPLMMEPGPRVRLSG